MERDQKKPGNYLSIDGGRSALPALYITDEMCRRLQFDLKSDEEVRVGDHVDLLGGSGNGAVAAILLGRMGLTSSQAIDAYHKLEPTLSVQATKVEDERRRNSEAFNAAFTEVLVETGFTANTPMMDETAPKTVIWTLSTANLLVAQPIRSYRVRSTPSPSCTILEAACASIASPDKFLPVTLGSGHEKLVLIDATAGYANPIKELLKEAQGLFGDEAEVSSIVSLGAGKEDVLNISGVADADALAEVLRRTALDSERTHEEIRGRLHQLSIYFRLNVERGLDRPMDAWSIYERTTAYMKEGGIDKLLDNAVKNIRFRPKGSSLKDINSVTVVEITMKPRPSLVDNFVGREYIIDALKVVHFSNRLPLPTLRKPVVSVLMGLGGSGKTQTSLKFALEYRDGLVYFFDASSEAKLKADFELAIRARDLGSRLKSHDDSLIWFSDRSDDWLIIMDNADDPSLDLFRFIPKSSRGNVIITTRNATHKKLAPTSSHLIEALSPIDASTLILKGSSYPDNESNRAYALLISEELGYLPLALAHAAAYISDHQCLSMYLSIYRERRAKFLATRPALSEDYSLSVATTIQMSLDSIPQAARNIMVLLSLFEVTSIAQIIIAKSAKRQFRYLSGGSEDEALNPQTGEYAMALMAIFCPSGKWSESDFNDIIQYCLQYSLLQVTASGEARFYSMHVLVQVYLQSISTPIQEHQPGQLIVRLLGSSITVDHHHKYHAFNRLLVPHLRLIASNCVVEAGDHFGYGQVLCEQGAARLSTEHFERCLVLRRSSLGDENMDTVDAMQQLSVCCDHIGRYPEASDLKMKVLDLRKRVLSDEHPDTLMGMSNLAISYFHLGRYQEALELQVKVLDLRKRVLGDEHPSTLKAISNLAIYSDVLKRHQEALELGVKVVDLRKRVSGHEHPDTVYAMAHLAASYSDLGRLEEALELGVKVLDLRKRIFGDEHPDTLLAMSNLAIYNHRLERYQEALELREKVLDLLKRISGDQHLEILNAMGHLAVSYNKLGRYQEALELRVKVLDLRKRISGDEHLKTLDAMGNLAASYIKRRNYQAALELRLKVLDLRKRISDDEHPETMDAMDNLVESYNELGRHREALELTMKVLNLRKRISGDEHPDTMHAMDNLAVSYNHLGKHQEALKLRLKVLDLRKRISGDEHPETLNAMHNLAASYHELGRYHKALELGTQVVDLRKRISGEMHADTVRAMANLAVHCSHREMYKEALEIEKKVLEIWEESLGRDHPDTIHLMFHVAINSHNLGMKVRAISLLQTVVPLQEKALGTDHSLTIIMKKQLEDFLK